MTIQKFFHSLQETVGKFFAAFKAEPSATVVEVVVLPVVISEEESIRARRRREKLMKKRRLLEYLKSLPEERRLQVYQRIMAILREMKEDS